MRRIATVASGFLLAAAVHAEAAYESYSLSGEATPKFDEPNIVAITATGVSNVRGEDPANISNAIKSASLKARGRWCATSQDVSATQLLESFNNYEEVTTGGQSVATQADFERMAEAMAAGVAAGLPPRSCGLLRRPWTRGPASRLSLAAMAWLRACSTVGGA